MKRIGRGIYAAFGAVVIAGLAIATAVTGNASPLQTPALGGGTLECSYQTDTASMALSGACGSDSALGSNGGHLSGQIDRANRSASGDMALSTTLGTLHGAFDGSLTSGGTIVGEFTPAGGGVGIPFVATQG